MHGLFNMQGISLFVSRERLQGNKTKSKKGEFWRGGEDREARRKGEKE
jgi:hypothetical protein